MPVESAILVYVIFVIYAFTHTDAAAKAGIMAAVAVTFAMFLTLLYALAGADWWNAETVQTAVIDATPPVEHPVRRY
jgi:hypothetical protein